MYLSPERCAVSVSLKSLGLSKDPKDAQRRPSCFLDASICDATSLTRPQLIVVGSSPSQRLATAKKPSLPAPLYRPLSPATPRYIHCHRFHLKNARIGHL